MNKWNRVCIENFPIVLCSADMQWHRPVTTLSSSSSMTTQSAHNKPKQMNSSMPFRELLLQQQQSKLLADAAASAAAATIASGAASTTNTEITASAIISSAVEQDRLALATHFQERDRLILQHQQHQLQRKQKQKQLDEHEKPFSSSNRIRDFVIGGGVDRVANIASGKTSGKWLLASLLLLLLFHFFLHVYIIPKENKSITDVFLLYFINT